MNKKAQDLAKEAIEHSDEAAQLLKKSNQVHQMAKQGIIEVEEGLETALKLNAQAIDETEKAIELQKEFIAEEEKE